MKYNMSLGEAIMIVVEHAWKDHQWSKGSMDADGDGGTEFEQALTKLDSEVMPQTQLVLAERERILACLYSHNTDEYTAQGFRTRVVEDIRNGE